MCSHGPDQFTPRGVDLREDVPVKEYADFLGSQSPYDALTSDDLRRLVDELQVEYFTAGSMIVAADQEPLDHMWVVRSGVVEVLDRGRVVDHLGTGDTFGHISVLTGLAPALSVRTGGQPVPAAS